MGAIKQGPFPTFESAVAAEYIAVSNCGAYSSSTLCGANTRRYHALLAAPLAETAGVYVVLSALEEVLEIGGARVYLSTNEFPGAIFPQGYKHISSFEMNPLPAFTYNFQGVEVRKTVCLAPNECTVVVAYEVSGNRGDVTLEIRPLCAFRERHALTEANVVANLAVTGQGDWTSFQPYRLLPALRMRCPGEFRAAPDWYRHFQFRRDRERGHSGQEDLAAPGVYRIRSQAGKPFFFTATLEDNTGSGEAIVAAAEAEALEWTRAARRFPVLAARLSAGMRDFLLYRGSQLTLLRGLPWHAEWARHAFMALPGLLALGRFVEAEAILATWAKRAPGGVLPRFVDDRGLPGEPDLEGTLWFFEAVWQFLAYTKNFEWVKANILDFMHGALAAIDSGHAPARKGPDGLLLSSGAARTLAPKDGEAAYVEIQALYFNALKVAEEIAGHFRDEDSSRRFQAAAKSLQRAFNKLMWDPYNHVPIDSYSEAGIDRTPRPMCLLSVSLSHPILVRRRWEILVEQIEAALLTPRGILAVPPDFPGTKKFFPGDSYDQARRTGGIWPQFLGPFLVAHSKIFGKSKAHCERFTEYLKPLVDATNSGMLNHVPEFFDGADPFAARGAPTDAAAAGQIIWALTTKIDPRHYGGEEAF